MTTGRELSAAILDKRGLGMRSKTTAAGGTTYLVDTERLSFDTLDPNQYNGAYVRIHDDANNEGFVGAVTDIDPATGRLYFSPAVANAIADDAEYEVHFYSHPDESYKARDRALEGRCSHWRLRELSVVASVDTWSVAAYSGDAGGETNAAGSLVDLAFPSQYFAQALRITNSGANGIVGSPTKTVQPGQQMRVTGWVSVTAETAKIRLRDITNGADIALSGEDEFTLPGWQYFDLQGVVPAGCGKVQLWPGGDSASCVADWAGLAMIPVQQEVFVLESRVRSERDVGRVYVRPTLVDPAWSADVLDLQEIGCHRERASSLVRLRFPSAPALGGGVFYEERHFYTALQTAYNTAAERVIGDEAETDCPLEYLRDATVVELLEGRVGESAELNLTLLETLKDLAYWERQMGPEPIAVARPAGRRPGLMGLA